jgi:NitT/TauT family transport system substrate-binding protein
MSMRVNLIISILALAVSAFMSPSAEALESVSVRLSYTPWALHIPIYVAAAKGYYSDAGLDANILPGRGSTFSATTVGSGKEDFGVADSASVLAARAKGVPLVVVANLSQDNGVAFIATEKSGIAKVEDLKGRRVGIMPGAVTTIFLEALMKKHGLSMQDVTSETWRPGTDLPLLLSGSIEAETEAYGNELVTWSVEHPELKLKVWTMASLGFDTPGYALITSETLLKAKPDVIKGFVQATMKGSEYAIAHPEEAVAILVKAAPELNADLETKKWRVNSPSITSEATRKDGMGAIDRPKWSSLNDLMQTYGIIDKKVDLSALLQDGYR